jgi:PAS domain S-box-containing protein
MSISQDQSTPDQPPPFTRSHLAILLFAWVIAFSGWVIDAFLLPDAFLSQILAFLALSIAGAATVCLVVSIRPGRRLVAFAFLGTGLVVGGQILRLTCDSQVFAGMPILGGQSVLHGELRSFLNLSGVTALFVTFFLVILELQNSEYALQDAHGQLQTRVAQQTEQLTEANRQLVNEMGEREKARRALHENLKEAQAFSNRLAALLQATTALSRMTTVDALLEQAVHLGRMQLGFDRMAIWLLSEDPQYLQGTYGIDEQGNLRDERSSRLRTSLPRTWPEILGEEKGEVVCWEGSLTNDKGETVGVGEAARAALWDGARVIGTVAVDNVLAQRPMTDMDRKLLGLYAASLGNLYAIRCREADLERSNTIIESSHEAVAAYDLKGNLLYSNKAFQELFKREGEKLAIISWDALYTGPSLAMMQATILPRLRQGDSWEGQLECRDAEGRAFPVWQRADAVHDAAGNVRCVFALLHDATEWQTATDALHRRDRVLEAVSFSAQRFLRMACIEDCMDEVLARLGESVEADRVYVFENHLSASGASLTSQRYEWTASRIAAQQGKPNMVNHPWQGGGMERWAKVLSEGQVLSGSIDDFPAPEQEILRPQGIRSLVAVPIFVAGDWWGFIGFDACRACRVWSSLETDALRVAAGILGAVVEKERAVQQLRESEENFRAAAEDAFDAILIMRQDGRHVYANKQAAQLSGFSVPRLLEMGISDLAHPEEGEKLMEHFHKRIREAAVPYRYEARIVTASGKIVPVEVAATQTTWKGTRAGLWFLRDISERKQAERVIAEQQFEMAASARLSSLGVMAAGVSHEINNPLASISAAAEQLQELLEDGRQDPEWAFGLASKIMRNAERIERIIRGLRLLSREGSGDPFRKAPLRRIVEDSLELCHARFRDHGVRLISSEAPAGLDIECRETQIAQVLMNLLNNAFDAVKNSPEKWVMLGIDVGDGQVSITVTDSGAGVPFDLADSVFEPFFTTKDIGHGTGLGLSISKMIAESHHGELQLDRSSDHTRFVLRLPLTQQARPFREPGEDYGE